MTVALGKAAIPIISLALIAAVYGLQVCIVLNIALPSLICLNPVIGAYFHTEERVHAGGMDGHLPPCVCYLLFAEAPLVVADFLYSSYPVYSFFLPIYSFWCMDDFSWGNTRVVVGEGNNKKVIMAEDEKFDESMIPLKKFSGTWKGFPIS